jgi:hypothetical protein
MVFTNVIRIAAQFPQSLFTVETNRIEVGGRRVWRGFWSPARKSRKTEA